MGLYGACLGRAGRLVGRCRKCVRVTSCEVWEEWNDANSKTLKKVCGSFARQMPEGGSNCADSHCLMNESVSGFKSSNPPGAFSGISCSSAVEAILEKVGSRNSISTAEFEKVWEEILPAKPVTSTSPDIAASEAVRQGIVMHCGDAIYLEGSKLAHLVENSLPSSQSVIDNKLNTLHAELAPLESANEQMVKKAYIGAKRILWMGLGGLVVQFLVLFDLTYFVYSWNETEPVTYFLRYALFIGAYMYLMRTNQNLGYTNFYSWLGNKRLRKLRKESGFNSERYFYLKEEVKKWERYSNSSRSLKCLADKSLANPYSSAVFLP